MAAVSSSEIEDDSVTFTSKTDLRQIVLGIQHPGWRNHPPITSHSERATPAVDELARAEVPIFRENVVEFHLRGSATSIPCEHNPHRLCPGEDGKTELGRVGLARSESRVEATDVGLEAVEQVLQTVPQRSGPRCSPPPTL